MNPHRDQRPNPDLLLKVVETEHRIQRRGKLKIFFGASAGVGKTFAMMEEALKLKEEGLDVVAGVVETHGRPYTEKLLAALPPLPKRTVEHKGIEIKEFDLDAALARKPALVLIDELAHNNAPGSRHPKRWQDVEELLDAGINVFTTLNVQHLESLNDVVTSITGVSVQETVPDSLFDEADDVQLVDITTEELLDRMREGNVYVAPGAKDRAAQNFFTKTNLMSLRELALRRTAEHVDADTDYHRFQAGLFTPNVAGDRFLVCVGRDALAAKVVRTTQRIAASMHAPWYAISVETVDTPSESRGYQRQQRALRIAEQNGARIIMLQEDRLGDALLNFARANGITKIIVGRTIRSPWVDLIRGSVVEYLIRHSGDIDVYVITGRDEKRKRVGLRLQNLNLTHYGWAVLLAMFCTGLGVTLTPLFKPIDVLMIYLIGVLAAAVRLGRGPSLLFSFLSIAAFNFFFIEPFYTFSVMNQSYWLTFVVMLMTAIIMSSQASRLRKQTLMSRRAERETQALYSLTRELAAAREQGEMIDITIKHLGEAVGSYAAIWLYQADGGLAPTTQDIHGDPVKEEIVARWAFDHMQPAGLGTNTMPSAKAYYHPLSGGQAVYGVLGITPKKSGELNADERASVETFAHLLTVALERAIASSSAERLRVDTEGEKLKNTFLSSMSHDLRTPLASIRGSADTLAQNWKTLDAGTKDGLLHSIGGEAERLSKVVNNLLDLTRFETGRMAINRQPYYLSELIGATLGNMHSLLVNHPVTTDIASDLPMVSVDGLLIGQLLQNLLENAAAFSPKKKPITISARLEPEGMQISIADQGPGLPAGSEKQIFDKFVTIARRDRPKGTGLGLAICQAIVTAHGGRIWAENNPNGGARLNFIIPEELVLKTPEAP